jgi:flagellar FliL protein
MADEPEKAAPEKKSKKKLAMIVVGLLVAGGAYQFVLKPKPKGPTLTAEEAAAAEEAAEAAKPTVNVPVEPITLNLSDGRFLKVGLAFVVAEEDMLGGGHGATSDPKALFAPALDAAIEVLGGKTYNDLVTPAGRHEAKAALLEKINGHGEHEEEAHIDEETLASLPPGAKVVLATTTTVAGADHGIKIRDVLFTQFVMQ